MPRVFPDQKNKFDSDDIFKKLSQESDVKYTGYKDKPHEERKQKFLQDLSEGHTVVTFIATGTNLTLLFCQRALSDDRPPDTRPSRENVDFEREMGKVHMTSHFIMNGVCIKWVGWIDMDALTGKARLLFDDENAKVEDEVMRQVMKETQERVRLFEDNQRKWQEQQQVDSPQMTTSSQ